MINENDKVIYNGEIYIVSMLIGKEYIGILPLNSKPENDGTEWHKIVKKTEVEKI